MNKTLIASRNPIDDINAVAYAGQSPQYRMYKQGYEDYFEQLPVLSPEDPNLDLKLTVTKTVMLDMAKSLSADPWTQALRPLPGEFNRTILAMESPVVQSDGKLKEGQEIILARWGNGKTSPVHGHADGLLYEQLIFGTMRVNSYRIVNHKERVVRPVSTEIYKGFTNIAARYTPPQEHTRSALVHNFTSIGDSASLHYVPEHTRDGRDNQFTVEYFDGFVSAEDFVQLNAQQGIEQLRIGDVALVRSANVPEYGDHFIVITGRPILKEHGLRPQDVAIHAPQSASLLDKYAPIMGLTLLKLNASLRDRFHKFHGITVSGNQVILPTV